MAHSQGVSRSRVPVDGGIINLSQRQPDGSCLRHVIGDQTCGNGRLNACAFITTTAQVTADLRPALPSAVSASSASYLPTEKIERLCVYHSDKEDNGKVLSDGEPQGSPQRPPRQSCRDAVYHAESPRDGTITCLSSGRNTFLQDRTSFAKKHPEAGGQIREASRRVGSTIAEAGAENTASAMQLLGSVAPPSALAQRSRPASEPLHARRSIAPSRASASPRDARPSSCNGRATIAEAGAENTASATQLLGSEAPPSVERTITPRPLTKCQSILPPPWMPQPGRTSPTASLTIITHGICSASPHVHY